MSEDSSARYYRNYKERPLKKTKRHVKYIKRQQYGCKRYGNLQEDERQRLVEYRKNHFEMSKKTNSKHFS